MAATQYQVFCRYYNAKASHAALNNMDVKWTSWESRPSKSIDGASELISYNTEGEPNGVYQNLWIRPEDGLYGGKGTNAAVVSADYREQAILLDNRLQQVVINATVNTNPKYDMIFTYAGIGTQSGEAKRHVNPETDTSIAPVCYYEKMKRLDMCPWFLYATCGSLSFAMEKGEELVRIMGVENVLIGKVVSLDQYIDIV